MPKTYAQLTKQIEALTHEAERMRRKETDGVIMRIREAIGVYQLTAADLGLESAGRSHGSTNAKSARKTKSKRKMAGVVRYRDPAGNSWTGFGPKPRWLREAIEGGKDIKEFMV